MSDVCPACGETNAPDAEFCPMCKSFLGWDGAASGRPGPLPPGPVSGTAATEDTRWIPVTRSAAGQLEPQMKPGLNRRRSLQDPPARRLPLANPPEAGHPRTPLAAIPAGRTSTLLGPGQDRLCPQCGTVNGDHLRFCRKCGLTLVELTSAAAPTQSGSPSPKWWQRWFPYSGDAAGRAAWRAYRRTLPLGFRLRRALLALLVVALLGGGLAVIGHNPVSWVRNRWYDMRNTLVQVADVQAFGTPSGSDIQNYPGAAAVDGVADTAWAARWTATTPAPECRPPAAVPAAGSTGSLQLVLNAPVTVRAVSVAAGLGATDPLRAHEWRPKTLQLAFSNGECSRVVLKNVPTLQQLPLPPTRTTEIRISVVDTYAAAADQSIDVVAISEVQLFSRP